jgi:hypothetical protein
MNLINITSAKSKALMQREYQFIIKETLCDKVNHTKKIVEE